MNSYSLFMWSFPQQGSFQTPPKPPSEPNKLGSSAVTHWWQIKPIGPAREDSRVYIDFHSSACSLPPDSLLSHSWARSALLLYDGSLAGAQIHHAQLPMPPWILQPQHKTCVNKGGTAPPQASQIALQARHSLYWVEACLGLSPPLTPSTHTQLPGSPWLFLCSHCIWIITAVWALEMTQDRHIFYTKL